MILGGSQTGVEHVFNVADYGATQNVLNNISAPDGAITTGTNVLTSALITPAMAGQTVQVAGAGANVTPTGTTTLNSNQITAMSSVAGIVPGMLITGAGVPAGTQVQAIISATVIQLTQNASSGNVGATYTISGQLSTTIASAIAGQANLAANAGTTVTGATVMAGNLNTTALTAAINALNARGRGVLYLPEGDLFTGALPTITASGKMVGAGPGATGFGTTLIAAPGTNADFLTFATKLFSLQEFGLDGNYLGQSGAGRGLVINNAYVRMNDLIIIGTNGDAVALTGASSVGTHSANVDIRAAQGYGLNIAANAYDNDITSYNIGNCGKSGVLCAAGDLAATLLHTWGNGNLGVANDGSGLKFSGGVGACRFNGCYFENNLDKGVYGANSGNSGHTFNGCLVWKNRTQGIYLFGAKWISITGCTIYDNGQGGSANQFASGINNDTGTGWTVGTNTFYDDQTTKTQTYAYYELNTTNFTTVIGNTMRAVDHKTGSNVITGANNTPVAANMGTYNTV